MSRYLTLALCVGLVGLFAACSGVESRDSPRIQVQPEDLNFGDVAVDDSLTLSLIIENVGAATLVVSNARLETNTSFVTVDWPGELRIEPGDDEIITVTYAPERPDQTTGDLILESNDSRSPNLAVPILAARPTPRVAVFPPVLDFGFVPEGSNNTIDSAIQNIGSGPLILCDVRTIGAPEISSNLTDALADQAGGSGYVVLLPSTTDNPSPPNFDFLLNYDPQTPGPDAADLVIEYDSEGYVEDACADGNVETVTFEITGEAGSPTLQVQPNPVNFGETPLDFSREELVTITNVGDLDLDVTAIRLDDARTSPDFAIEELPELPATLQPDDLITLTVSYSPDSLASDAGVLVVEHSDGQDGTTTTEVTVAGVGVEDACPVPVARGFVREDPENRRGSEIDWALPLQTVVLDATESFDPDGELVDYVWEIIDRPADAVNGLRPFDGAPDNPALQQYFIPLAGRYEFQLTVFDELGTTCESARLTLVATPQEAIAVELTWSNPSDPNEADTEGSDVDLHFLKMPSTWFHPQFDTYFSNTEPSWAPELPSLDIDDTDGAGPETAQLDNPQPDECYAIGVHYFREAFGTAYPTVRIYVDGVLRDEIYGELRATDDFWDVARIHWPSRTIYRVDERIENFDSDDGVVPGVTDEMIRNGHCTTLD